MQNLKTWHDMSLLILDFHFLCLINLDFIEPQKFWKEFRASPNANASLTP